MTNYRTGNHRGVTVETETHEIVAVVVNGDQELAERICALLNGFQTNPRGYHPTCVETTTLGDLAKGKRSFICGPDCPPPPEAELGVDEEAPGSPLSATETAGQPSAHGRVRVNDHGGPEDACTDRGIGDHDCAEHQENR